MVQCLHKKVSQNPRVRSNSKISPRSPFQNLFVKNARINPALPQSAKTAVALAASGPLNLTQNLFIITADQLEAVALLNRSWMSMVSAKSFYIQMDQAPPPKAKPPHMILVTRHQIADMPLLILGVLNIHIQKSVAVESMENPRPRRTALLKTNPFCNNCAPQKLNFSRQSHKQRFICCPSYEH